MTKNLPLGTKRRLVQGWRTRTAEVCGITETLCDRDGSFAGAICQSTRRAGFKFGLTTRPKPSNRTPSGATETAMLGGIGVCCRTSMPRLIDHRSVTTTRRDISLGSGRTATTTLWKSPVGGGAKVCSRIANIRADRICIPIASAIVAASRWATGCRRKLVKPIVAEAEIKTTTKIVSTKETP